MILDHAGREIKKMPDPFPALRTEDKSIAEQTLKEEQEKGHDAWIDSKLEPGFYLVMVRPEGTVG